MTTPAVTVLMTTPVIEAARLMETAGVRRLPVVDLLGRVVGMVTNRDLLKVFLRPDDAIKRHVVDLFSTVDGGRSSVLVVDVTDGHVVVAGEVDRRSVAESLTARIEVVDGVVSVANHVSWLLDDTVNAMPVSGF
jgi:CBS domain-containing protein